MAEIENDNAAVAVPPNTVRYQGVRKRRRVNGIKYGAEIIKPGQKRSIWLGTYDTEKKAAQVYDTAARWLKGPGAKLNFSHDDITEKAKDASNELNPRNDVSNEGDKNNSNDIIPDESSGTASSSKAGDITSTTKASRSALRIREPIKNPQAPRSKAGGGVLKIREPMNQNPQAKAHGGALRIQEKNQNPQAPHFSVDIVSSSNAGVDVLRTREPNQNPQVPRFLVVNGGDAPFQPTYLDKFYMEILTRARILFPSRANFRKVTVDYLSDFHNHVGSSERVVHNQPPFTTAVYTELRLAPLGSK
ncbi:ethylene-responsive transcription factor 1-like [Capsicum chacoense]